MSVPRQGGGVFVFGEKVMSVYHARRWLIGASLIAAGSAFCFFMLAPVLGYPLRHSQAQSVLQIVLPVFLGYLGAATQFVFQKTPSPEDAFTISPTMSLLVRGPIALFLGMIAVAIFAFGYSNRLSAPPGEEGMSVDQLSTAVTAATGLLAVTTNVVVAYLFAVEKKADTKFGP
jgi:uncharacterized membrane protein YidH (DUF202 family)